MGTKPTEENPHAGHRRRMRKQFMRFGLDGFAEHEILELLLFDAIPRKNTNEIAHMLIYRFGSLANVLNATKEELQEVPGIGPKSADLIKLPQEIMKCVLATEKSYVPIYIRNGQDAKAVLDEQMADTPLPALFLLCISVKDTLLGIYNYPLDPPAAGIKLGMDASRSQSTRVILVERHDCPAFPLSEDRLSQIRLLVKQLWVLDYLVTEYYLMFTDGIKGLRRRGQLI